MDALVRKDREALAPFAARETALETVRQAYGDLETVLSKIDGVASLRLAGSEITDIAKALNGGGLSVSVDLGETHGFRYHTGLVFGIYSLSRDQLLVRGGRYDHVGESFGRARAATGFSADLKTLVRLAD